MCISSVILLVGNIGIAVFAGGTAVFAGITLFARLRGLNAITSSRYYIKNKV